MLPSRERWIQSGDPTDEAAWFCERLEGLAGAPAEHGTLSRERLLLAAHLGHPAARLALRRAAIELPKRTATRAGATHALRQWVLSLGDLCAPSERLVIARRALAVLLYALGHDHRGAALDALLPRDRPWSALRTVAGWATDVLDELEDPERVRRRVRFALLAWSLRPGQAARPYDASARYRLGERVAGPSCEVVVRRAGKRAFEGEGAQGVVRLRHRSGEWD